METRSNKYLVGGVVAILIAALLGFIVWASPDRSADNRRYDLLFERSVAGLAERSTVSFSGVPVGRVARIRFDPVNPDIVRVRIIITDPDVPILQGTVATLDRDLFGAALITLTGAVRGSPPIVPTRGRVAVIPVEAGGGLLGEDPVSMVENVARTTEKLNAALGPTGQQNITKSITELEQRSAAMADRMPRLADAVARTRTSIRDGATAAQAMAEKAAAMNAKMQSQRGRTAELRQKMRTARAGIEQLEAKAEAARPMLQELADGKMREQVRELRGSVADFNATVQQVDSAGAGALLSEPQLPDYESRD